MNKFYIALTVLFAATAILYNLEPQRHTDTIQYLDYLRQYSKPMPSADQLLYRSTIYAQYLINMEKHNSDASQTWKIGVNQFSDLTKEEFLSTYLGQISQIPISSIQEPINSGLTASVDWRTKGIITSIKNQGSCGSCWAFAATASHQTYQIQFKNQPNTIDLSEQQLVDCAKEEPYHNDGCNGGFAVRALEWINHHGQTTESAYPYKAVNQDCAISSGSYRTYGTAESSGCQAIQELIVRNPLAVRVDASNWSLYKSGIFNNCDKKINHAVYMVASSDSAWTIKNSWGKTWGEEGYIRLAKGDTCAVCQGPSFAI